MSEKDIKNHLRGISAAWKNASPAETNYEGYSDGDYLMELREMEVGMSRESNRLQVVSKFVFADGKYKGHGKWRFDGLDSDSSISFFKAYCEVLGVEYPEDPVDLLEVLADFVSNNESLFNCTLKTKGEFQNLYVKGVSDYTKGSEEEEGSSDEEEEEKGGKEEKGGEDEEEEKYSTVEDLEVGHRVKLNVRGKIRRGKVTKKKKDYVLIQIGDGEPKKYTDSDLEDYKATIL